MTKKPPTEPIESPQRVLKLARASSSHQESDQLMEFYQSESDVEWRNSHLATARKVTPLLIEHAQADGLTEDPTWIAELVEENWSDRALRGRFINAIRDGALQIAGLPEESPARSLDVGLIHSPHINACAARTEAGKTIILFNIGVAMSLPMFSHAYLGAFWRNDHPPFCDRFSQIEFGRACLAVSSYCITGRMSRAMAPAVACEDHGGLGQELSEIAEMGELFIMMHEYGHVLLGHLEDFSQVPSDTPEAMLLSRRQELEADTYAMQRVIDHAQRNSVDAGGFLVGPAVVFQMFELMEFVGGTEPDPESDTHPPPQERWANILDVARRAGATIEPFDQCEDLTTATKQLLSS